MPVPVSVTGYTNKAGAQSTQSLATNCELVSEGPFARVAQAQAQATEQPKAQVNNAPAAPAAPTPAAPEEQPLVEINGLNFTYPGVDGQPLEGIDPVIVDMKMKLYPGECCILLGANGAGKTTLLKIIGGKHMVPKDAISVMGCPPFHETGLTINGTLSYIGGTWQKDVAFAGYNVPLTGDFPAGQMIENIRGVDPARRKELMEVFDINPHWKMHQVSDGQRRRVQLCIGLLKEYQVLLLDEITVDLDVLGRADMLTWLKNDAKKRNATILYATHIFDGLESWATHIAYVARSQLQMHKPLSEFPEVQETGLLRLVESWLRPESDRQRAEKAKRKEMIAKGELKEVKEVRNNGWIAGTLNTSLAMPGSSNAVMRM
mmetsp:Transcript_4595/g.5309  ORF Transcript_4595/g.5309 Transcript_4595/m.5309 type:complete len:375 (-) Transcript_4595:431-1555(-)|eukprot:CAMPEP_0197846376 /NCGR_PEP_ID=MMETSP1438-20131217/3128_1 /TAXON_ID=1461541 /ORGANISM="Pterosperma sp., Strain CCMP1384" /LENGTH=374 /DNA_ID=CAMNT_0043457999 /DNA_START=85 /DNA_END=1209 /DNA_ORIENTATION=-